MKLAGILMLSMCSAMTGLLLASNLQRRVQWIEGVILLLRQMHDRLRYLQMPTDRLIGQLAKSEQFRYLPFLQNCEGMLRRGAPLPVAWRQSLREAATGGFGREDAEIMASLGDVLGCVDLDGQLCAIQCTTSLLDDRLKAAREWERKRGRLYRSLGVLCGIAAAIILA